MTKRLSTHEKLLREAKRLQQRSNKRLRELEKNFPDNTWAEITLKGKLSNKGGLTPTGKVKVTKRMSEAELRNSIKAQKEFLADKRSTVAGLNSVKNKLKKSISKSLQENIDLSAAEADNLVQLFEEDTFKNLMNYIEPSDLFVLISEARNQNIHSEKRFIDLFRSQYNFSENRGIVKSLSNFYKRVYK